MSNTKENASNRNSQDNSSNTDRGNLQDTDNDKPRSYGTVTVQKDADQSKPKSYGTVICKESKKIVRNGRS